jgi:hypothetical protein
MENLEGTYRKFYCEEFGDEWTFKVDKKSTNPLADSEYTVYFATSPDLAMEMTSDEILNTTSIASKDEYESEVEKHSLDAL